MRIPTIYMILIILVVFIVSGCGAGNPNAVATSNISKQTQIPINNTTISVYAAQVHTNTITNYAISLLKDKGGLTQKQLAILNDPYYMDAIMSGMNEEQTNRMSHFYNAGGGDYPLALSDGAKYYAPSN